MDKNLSSDTSFKDKRPDPKGLARYRTLTLPLNDQFDYWQSLFPNIDLNLVDPSLKEKPFDAEVVTGIAPNGIAFGQSKSANTHANFGSSAHDNILVSLSVAGSVAILDNDGNAQTVTPETGIVLIDIGRSSSVISSGEHRHVFLSVPRELAFSNLTHDPFADKPVINMPTSSGLAPFLTTNLQLLDRQVDHLSADEAALTIRQAAEIAMSCLNADDGVHDLGHGRALRAAFLAACDHIDRHLGNPDLTAEAIAISLGFSRAHLYRVFASHGKTVAAVLRDRRLARARNLLASGRTGHLDAVAFAVGYHNTAAFGRAFKKQFGVTPRDYRVLLAKG